MSEPGDGFTAAELGAMRLPGLPQTARPIQVRAVRERWPFTERRTRGGTERVYPISALPAEAQAELARRFAESDAEPTAEPDARESAAWATFESAPEKHQQIARERFRAVNVVAMLLARGARPTEAFDRAVQVTGVPLRSLRRWHATVRDLPEREWLPALLPAWTGGAGRTAECSPEAWAFFRDDYLRPERPSVRACYRRLDAVAKSKGWTIPSVWALQRRIEREIPREVIVLRREGQDALKRMYAAQERDRSVFHALQAVCADGHVFDVLVRWLDGDIGRVVLVAFQDLYSGKILSWRVDRTENADLVRLAFADVVERYGIPSIAYLDNGRAFASKWLTGGMQHRFRFKVRAEEPQGIFTALGVEVHWATPYHGQAKPIERAFRDLCETVARHPAFSGAYTGSDPTRKPSNYGSRAVDLEEFLRVLDAQIREHNARQGRRSKTCRGRSFDQTFAESYAVSVIAKATEAQRRMLLLAAEGVRARAGDGSIHLLGNRYWSEALVALAGQQVVVRFDPQNAHKGVHVYRTDGPYVAFADCIEAVGFGDTQAAREHARKRNTWLKAQKEAAKLASTFSPAELAAMHMRAQGVPEVAPATKVIRPVFGCPSLPHVAAAAEPAPPAQSREEQDEFLASIRRTMEAKLEEEEARFAVG